MDAKTIKQATKTYNNIMRDLCLEHCTIGTNLSEDTENWNLRDMVAEMDYQLNIWLDPDCMYYIDAHDEYQPTIQVGNRTVGEYLYNWQKEVARMKRFIAKYETQITNLQCHSEHCSRFDNKQKEK